MCTGGSTKFYVNRSAVWLLPSWVLILLIQPLAAYGSRCDTNPIYIASECLKMPECAWCCERPVGSQCFDPSEQYNALSCSEAATLRNSSVTCGARCQAAAADCDSCEDRNWCYFCTSSNECQPAYETCKDGRVIQSCDMQDMSEWNLLIVILPLLGTGGLLIVSSTIMYVVLLVWQCRGEETPEANVTNEQTPLLAETGSNGDHGDAANTDGGNDAQIDEERVVSNTSDNTGEGREVNASEECSPELSSELPQLPASVAQKKDGTTEEAGARSAAASVTSNSDLLCHLCLDAYSTVTFLPCYHTCCCEMCCTKLRPTGDKGLTCPFCRVKILAMVSLRGLSKGND